MFDMLKQPPPTLRRAITSGRAELTIRSAAHDDAPALADFFAALSPADLRFRFVSSMRKVSHDVIDAMTHPDHEHTEHLVAFVEGAPGIAASAVIAFDERDGTAEVALAVRSRHPGWQVSWTLLDTATAYAALHGSRRMRFVQLGDPTDAIALEWALGFTFTPCPGDATMILFEKEIGASFPANVPPVPAWRGRAT